MSAAVAQFLRYARLHVIFW